MVQMALGEAKAKAKTEFRDVLEKIGKSVEELHAYVDAHPEMKRGLYKVPKYKESFFLLVFPARNQCLYPLAERGEKQ